MENGKEATTPSERDRVTEGYNPFDDDCEEATVTAENSAGTVEEASSCSIGELIFPKKISSKKKKSSVRLVIYYEIFDLVYLPYSYVWKVYLPYSYVWNKGGDAFMCISDC